MRGVQRIAALTLVANGRLKAQGLVSEAGLWCKAQGYKTAKGGLPTSSSEPTC